MSRVAVCLLFIAILHTGIITFSQANEPSTDGVSKNDEETTASKVEEEEEKSGVSSKKDPKVEEASDVPVKKYGKPAEEKEAKANGSKKEDVSEKTITDDTKKFLPDVLKGAPVEHTKVLFELPKNFLGPVTVVGSKIGEAVSKSIDTAKDLAGGTFNFLRTSAKSLFEK